MSPRKEPVACLSSVSRDRPCVTHPEQSCWACLTGPHWKQLPNAAGKDAETERTLRRRPPPSMTGLRMGGGAPARGELRLPLGLGVGGPVASWSPVGSVWGTGGPVPTPCAPVLQALLSSRQPPRGLQSTGPGVGARKPSEEDHHTQLDPSACGLCHLAQTLLTLCNCPRSFCADPRALEGSGHGDGETAQGPQKPQADMQGGARPGCEGKETEEDTTCSADHSNGVMGNGGDGVTPHR